MILYSYRCVKYEIYMWTCSRKGLSFVCNINLEQSHWERTLFHLFLSTKLAAFLKQLFHVSSVHNCSVLAGEYYLLKYHFLSSISLLALVHFSATPLHLLTCWFLWETIYSALDCFVCCLFWGFFCGFGFFFQVDVPLFF